MTFPLKNTLISLTLLLAACRSAPIQYHTLTPTQSPPSARTNASILIEQVSVPPQVDRTQIVIREGDSGLAILETQRWGASLSEELRSALLDSLSGSSSERKLSLRVEVQRFDSMPGQYALLDAKWYLRNVSTDNKTTSLNCRTTVQRPTGAAIDELVIAHQNNIKRLAAAINQATDSGRCPRKI